jgi:all-trans-retinol dehydrogenase (NAD+)
VTEIAGATVLVTGAGSGIGRLMCVGMARLGARIVAWDIDAASLEDLSREIKGITGRPAHPYVCDVSDRHEVYEVADRVKDEVGFVDILVNNAGIVSGQPFLDNPDESVERTFAVNALAPFWVTKAFLREMVERDHGHLVTIISASAIMSPPRLSDYGASKWAAAGFEESLRNELRQLAPGVRTTRVIPYYIDTGMFDGVTPNRIPWLLPVQEPREVVTRIVDAILRDKRRLLLPRVQFSGWLLRILPLDVYDRLLDALGIHAAMDHFVGRARPEDVRPQRDRSG